MGLLEPYIRRLKSKIHKFYSKNENSIENESFSQVLEKATFSMNRTITTHGKEPAQVNRPEFDPFLRSRLNKRSESHLLPFNVFYLEQLKLQNRLRQPRQHKRGLHKDLRLNDTVFIDYDFGKTDSKYSLKRGPEIFRISRIETSVRPYLFKLVDLHNEPVGGWFYSKELTNADLSSLKVDRVLSTTKYKGHEYIKVSFDGFPSTFDRWIRKD